MGITGIIEKCVQEMVKKREKSKSNYQNTNRKKAKGLGNRPSLDEYYGLEAEAYAKSNWMRRNQQKTTQFAIELLNSNQYFQKIPSENIEGAITLDLGCGTGYSSQILATSFHRVVGLDLSRDMLSYIPSNLLQPNSNLQFIQADLRALPLRENISSAIISISAYNFVSEGAKEKFTMVKLIRKALMDLFRSLSNFGRVVIEFYPTELEEKTFLQLLQEFPFQGGLLKTDSGTRKEKKFLVLQKIKPSPK